MEHRVVGQSEPVMVTIGKQIIADFEGASSKLRIINLAAIYAGLVSGMPKPRYFFFFY